MVVLALAALLYSIDLTVLHLATVVALALAALAYVTLGSGRETPAEAEPDESPEAVRGGPGQREAEAGD